MGNKIKHDRVKHRPIIMHDVLHDRPEKEMQLSSIKTNRQLPQAVTGS